MSFYYNHFMIFKKLSMKIIFLILILSTYTLCYTFDKNTDNFVLSSPYSKIYLGNITVNNICFDSNNDTEYIYFEIFSNFSLIMIMDSNDLVFDLISNLSEKDYYSDELWLESGIYKLCVYNYYKSDLNYFIEFSKKDEYSYLCNFSFFLNMILISILLFLPIFLKIKYKKKKSNEFNVSKELVSDA